MTNLAGDGGVRLTVAEGVVLHETCIGGTTEECRYSVGGSESCIPTRGRSYLYIPTHGRSRTERDCGVRAYQRTYCGDTKTENENA